MSYRYVQFGPILNGWPTVLLTAAIGMVLAVVLPLIARPLEYSSTTRALITLKTDITDPYNATRSVEVLAESLAGIVGASDVYNFVFNSGYDIDRTHFPSDPIEFRKLWMKTVETSVVRGSGLLVIRAYHSDPEQAKEIANAVAFFYVTKGWEYTSGPGINVRIVDDAVTSRYPVRPNLPMNAVSGFFLGGIAGAGYLLIEADRLRRRHQVAHE